MKHTMKACPFCGCQNDERHSHCGMCGEELETGGVRRIVVRCSCGEVYHAAGHQVGSKIKCWKCDSILEVGRSADGIGKKSADAASHLFQRAHGETPASRPPKGDRRSMARYCVSLGIVWVAGILLL